LGSILISASNLNQTAKIRRERTTEQKRWVRDEPRPFRGAAPLASAARDGRYNVPFHQHLIKLTGVYLSGFAAV